MQEKQTVMICATLAWYGEDANHGQERSKL